MSVNQSLAEKFLEEHQSEDDPYKWIVIYDFVNLKPPPKFWKNLDKLTSISSISRIQYSVFTAENKGDALALAKLSEYYGGTVEVFRCEAVEGGS